MRFHSYVRSSLQLFLAAPVAALGLVLALTGTEAGCSGKGCTFAWADEGPDTQTESAARASAPNPEANLAPGSDASFDKRLPPVLPGESVPNSGKRMKIWSTGGELASQKPPRPESTCRVLKDTKTGKVSELCDRDELPSGLGIVVDGRSSAEQR
jgi:hypothetical protein